jgi:hypothetical protein
MKFSLLFLLAFAFSCSPAENEENNQNNAGQTEDLSREIRISDFSKAQDSIRNEILKSKSEESLKGSVVEELYVRDLVKKMGDMLTFNLPFDLHGFDCGAPDCYTTDLSFTIPFNGDLTFPDQIIFKLSEAGCIEKDLILRDTMRLENHSARFVNYYCIELDSRLIIMSKDERHDFVYYFPDSSIHITDIERVNEAIDQALENDGIAFNPYRSSHLTSLKYDRTLQKLNGL